MENQHRKNEWYRVVDDFRVKPVILHAHDSKSPIGKWSSVRLTGDVVSAKFDRLG